MSRPRVKVAGIQDRLPRGTLQAAPEPERAPAEAAPKAKASKRMGRPPKAPGAKARGITVTLWPDELEALDNLQEEINAGLPAPVPRSDLARLAFALLLKKSPEQVLKALAEQRRK